YYDPSLGRFLTRDPVKDGRNWYTYCGNNPVGRADADGNDFAVIVYGASKDEKNPALSWIYNEVGTHAAIVVQDPGDRRVWWYYSLTSEGLDVIKMDATPGSQKWEDPAAYAGRESIVHYYFTDEVQDYKILMALQSIIGEPTSIPVEGRYPCYYNVLLYNCSTMIVDALHKAGLARPDILPVAPVDIRNYIGLPRNDPPRRTVYPPPVPEPLV
ncbi:MAG: hypothetical protein K6T17_07005, partial [Fimbriimonadales bacterium]|nr:hypothetical protein [Fimbriimonadales bacterium]